MTDETKILKCCICRRPIPVLDGWADGNNADPVVPNGRCCYVCNDTVVLPARIRRMMEAES